MRVPIAMTIFAVSAALGTAVVTGARVLESRNVAADQLTAGVANTIPASGPPRTPRSAAPPSSAPASSNETGADATDNPDLLLPGGATVNLRHKISGECLDSNSAGEVYFLRCNGGDYQRWKITAKSGDIRIFTDLATGRCLENLERGQTAPLLTARCDGNKFQNWFFITEPGLVSLQNDTTRLCMWNSPRPPNTVACKHGQDNLWWAVSIT